MRFILLVLSLVFLACEPMPISSKDADFIRDQTDEITGALRQCTGMVRNAARVALAPENESRRWANGSQTHWGQTKRIPEEGQTGFRWEENKRYPLIRVDPPGVWRVPRQQSILLGAKINYASGGTNILFRWQLDVGVGGARASYIFDANELQQITVPGEMIDLSLVPQANAGVFNPDPGITAELTCFIADGFNATEPAVYTEFFNIAPAPGTQDIDIPNGASSFRIVGIAGGGGDPFAAGVNYLLGVGASSTYFDSYNGLTDMLILHRAGASIPIPGIATTLRVTTGGVGALFGVMWGLEL